MTGQPVARSSAEALPKWELMRSRRDYLTCYRRGARKHGRFVTLVAVANELGHPRLGITASRKVGNAVVRHKLKRQIREIYRRWDARAQLPAVDFMIQVKPQASGAAFEALSAEMRRLIKTWRPHEKRRSQSER